MSSVGCGHIFNLVSDATFMFLVQLFENDISANQKVQDTEVKNDLLFAKTRLCVSKTSQQFV